LSEQAHKNIKCPISQWHPQSSTYLVCILVFFVCFWHAEVKVCPRGMLVWVSNQVEKDKKFIEHLHYVRVTEAYWKHGAPLDSHTESPGFECRVRKVLAVLLISVWSSIISRTLCPHIQSKNNVTPNLLRHPRRWHEEYNTFLKAVKCP
jgi:hypothetical protein